VRGIDVVPVVGPVSKYSFIRISGYYVIISLYISDFGKRGLIYCTIYCFYISVKI